MAKIGRNELCYCGSGKKYKKCCLQSDDQKQSENPPPPIKISAAILQVAQPLLEKFTSEHRIRAIITLAVMAWNFSLTKTEHREKLKIELAERLSEEMGGEDIATIMDQMDLLIENKYLLFPDIKYFVADYNLSFDEHGTYTLDVNSTKNYSIESQ